MYNTPINVSTGYTAPIKKNNSTKNVGTVEDSSSDIRFASYAMFVTAFALVAQKAMAFLG